MEKPNQSSKSTVDVFFQLLIDSEKQLFLIGFLGLVWIFKYFPGSQFTGFKKFLISFFKLIRFQNFSLYDIIVTIGKFQIPICNFLIFISFCGLVMFIIWYFLISRFNINKNIHALLGAKTIRMGTLCMNFYLIYNLLIVIFSNSRFPKFTGFWDYAFAWTFCGYLIVIVVYVNSNKDELLEKLKEKFDRTDEYIRKHQPPPDSSSVPIVRDDIPH